ncbi:MAG: transcriptional regulator [Pseudonocardiales bacterium]|nr:transcriptional regulator [Pseudonocardiales bacterium]
MANLLTFYGTTDKQERKAFLSLTQRANVPAWWQHYSDILPGWFEMYLGLEQASSAIRTYEPQFVPGLLQTREVARVVIQSGNPTASQAGVDRRVSLRMTRQEVLSQPGAPNLWTVIDEAALRRLDGRSTMRAQLEHLIKMGELPNVIIQAIPIHSSTHVAVGGPFSTLSFADPDLPDVTYLEQLNSAVYLHKSQDIEDYLMLMEQLGIYAKSPTETTEFLSSILKET